jgi:acetylornithine deacetylase
VVPDAAKLTVDSRTTPEFDNERMLAHLNEAAATEGGHFEVYSNRFRPVLTPDNSAVVRAALVATERHAPTVFPSVCDLFWVAHVPAIVMGPGRPERSHQADEFVRIPEVLDGVERYAATARGWLETVQQ